MITIEDRARLVKQADNVHPSDRAAMLIVQDIAGDFMVTTIGAPESMRVLKEGAIKLLKGGVQ